MKPTTDQLLTPLRELIVALRTTDDVTGDALTLDNFTVDQLRCLKVLADALTDDEVAAIPTELFDEHPARQLARQFVERFHEGRMLDWFRERSGVDGATAIDASGQLVRMMAVMSIVRELDIEAWRHGQAMFPAFLMAAVGGGSLAPLLHWSLCREAEIPVPPDVDAYMRFEVLRYAHAAYRQQDVDVFPATYQEMVVVDLDEGRYPLIGSDESLELAGTFERVVDFMQNLQARIAEAFEYGIEHWLDIEWLVEGADALTVEFKAGEAPPDTLDGIRLLDRVKAADGTDGDGDGE